MNEVLVLDVGHGNSTVIRHEGETVIVDAPLREGVVDALRSEGVQHVRLALGSHSDSDHCGGFIGLLLDRDIVVDEVRINADATRVTSENKSKFWGDLKTALKWAKENQGTRLRVELTDETSDDISAGAVRLEVLLPLALHTMDGVGAFDANDKKITANAMSAVIRVVMEGDPLVLLPGDMGASGLQQLIDDGVDVQARVLVFPHHGGLPEGAATAAKMSEFATSLIQLVDPETVIFSLGREGKNLNPRAELVEAVRAAKPAVHIACTQLSRNCSAAVLPDVGHLTSRHATGRRDGRCCLGTAVLLPGQGLVAPARDSHEQAVSMLPTRLCT